MRDANPKRNERPWRPPTINDVARLSGVSAATVTRALQGHPRVRATTRRRVEDAAAVLGYRPHTLARALVTGSSQTIGLLIPSSGDRFWAEVAVGAEERATEAGLSVLLAHTHDDPRRAARMLDVFLGKRVDGILLTAGAAGEQPLAQVDGLPPTVVVGWESPLREEELEAARRLRPQAMIDALEERAVVNGPNRVYFDDVAAARDSTEHLLGLGHERVAFVGAGRRASATLRLLGFRLALEDHGLPEAEIVECEPTLEGGREAATRALAGPERPTALVAYDDLVAIGALRAAHSLELRVPRDVSIVGFDDIDVAAYVQPPLTTIRQPKREMGRRGLDALLARAGADGPVRERLTGTLVVRDSTAAAA